MMFVQFFFIISLIVYSTFSWRFKNPNLINKKIFHGLLDDSIDLSDEMNGGILKKVLRKGNPSYGYPQLSDSVEISWTISLKDGTVVHKTNESDGAPFRFTLGANPREVILGWEVSIPTMSVGEISSVTIQPNYAFGAKGVPPMIGPNETIICELELLNIIPSLKRSYKSVGLNESIKEELMEKIQAGDNFISDQIVKKDGVNFNETSESANVKMFDEKTMKLDPNQRVKGESKTYSWEETPRTIDIEVPVPLGTKKSDLAVRIEADYIAVSCLQKTVFEGPLQGKINPSESMWAIAGDDIYATFRGERLIISLEKSFSSQEIWASVLNRDFLASQKNMIFKSD